MTWAATIRRGSGRWGFRLMVEGWPEEYVTSRHITHASGKDGRAVLAGLSYEGIVIEDGCDPLDGKVTAKGITFTIRATTGKVLQGGVGYEDAITASLSTWPDALAGMAGNLDSTATTFPGLVGGNDLADNTVYHMGTEAFRVGTYPTITRTIWQTHAQEHNSDGVTDSKTVYVYGRPPTMEGRRCYLYVYSPGDDLAGDGTLLWRGVVGRPAILKGDEWKLETLPITHLLKQTVGGGFGDVKASALYFNWASCWFGRLTYEGTSGVTLPLAGLYTVDTFIQAVNAQFVSQLVSTGANASFQSCVLGVDNQGWYVRAVLSGTPAVSFDFKGGSMITGFATTADKKKTGGSGWVYDLGPSLVVRWDDEFLVQGSYTLRLDWNELFFSVDNATALQGWQGAGKPGHPMSAAPDYTWTGPPAMALGRAANIMENVVQGQYTNLSQAASWPANRIYVDHDLTGATALSISSSFRAGVVFANGIVGSQYGISATGVSSLNINGVPTDVYYADLETDPGLSTDGVNGFHGMLNTDTEITVIHGYTVGSVVDFRNALVSESIHANDGTTPFITDDDLAPWVLALLSAPADVTQRGYSFAKPLQIEKVLAEELKLIAHYPFINGDGKIDIAPLPVPNASATIGNISGANLITPPDGMAPTVEPQRDGVLSQISLQQVYSAAEGDWKDEPLTVQFADVIGTHKHRGKGRQEIKPYSTPTNMPNPVEVAVLLVGYLSMASRDYAIVTINVPLSLFEMWSGSYVSLSFRGIPNGAGSRGVTNRACTVINRRWPMDPKVCMGTLQLWMPVTDLAGYAESAVAGAITGTDPNWVIALDPAINSYLCPRATSDDAAEGFRAGDLVRLVEINSATPIEVTATVSATGTQSISVVTDTLWDPTDAAGWIVIGQQGAATARQLKDFVYVADENMASSILLGSPLRRLA